MDTKLEPMKRTLLAACVIAGVLTSSCGTPKYCREGAFPRFLEEDWRTYCEAFQERVESPGNFELTELATFFGNHSARAKSIRDELLRYESPAACFEGPRAELEYRRLDTCAKDDDGQRQEIANAFVANLEPWLSDHRLRLSSLTPKVGDVEREASRIEKKVAEAFDFHSELDPSDFLKFADTVDAAESEYNRGATLSRDWAQMKKLAGSSSTIISRMDEQYGAEVTDLNAKFKELGDRVIELRERERYLEYAVYSVGKPCPQGIRATKELGIARNILKGKVAEVGGVQPRVTTGLVVDSRDEFEVESFEGFICGVRSKEGQFEGKPRQCTTYRYQLERQRVAGERRWGDWAVMAFEEAGAQNGVECALMK